jgi:hypothetical protein
VPQRVYGGERLHRQYSVEQARPGAAERLGHFDPHDAQVEQLVDEIPGNSGLVIHFPHARPDFAGGKFLHALAEQLLVVGQAGERGRKICGRFGHAGNVIIAKQG